MTTSQIKEKITRCGLKGTHQRIAIFEAVLNLDNHPTAEKIYNSISKKYPTISLGTVYKTLETFVEKDLITKVLTPNDVMRYEVVLENHHHLYDKKNDNLIDFHDEKLTSLLEKHFKKNEIPFFRIQDIELRITGEIIERQQKLEF